MLESEVVQDLLKKSRVIRRACIEIATKCKAAHLGSALSCIDILTTLYFKILNIDPRDPSWSDRDRFILSKGHAALALYAVLTERGFASKEMLKEYYCDGKKLACHPVKDCLPGVEVSTGSLGHGLPMGVGMAYAAKLDLANWKVYVVMSDGECDEGSSWEAILAAAQFKLDNLIAIVDYNKFQGFGQVKEVMNLEPFKAKWQAFGWEVIEVDGHNFKELIKALSNIPKERSKPTCIIAHTIKGKGLKRLEGTFESHYLVPDETELPEILEDLK